ncbi:MAG: hypothetical protein V1790_04215 [Planctomycetota bacterium]
MAWRPNKHLLEGELDNSTPDKVTGWMTFAGLDRKVTFELDGNFHRDIRGAKIRFRGDGNADDPEAASYMEDFALKQTGKVGDITAGLPPRDYSSTPYLEWYSEENGRVVLELDPEQVEVIGKPIPACESDPISREGQAENMAEFLTGLATAMNVPAIAVGGRDPLVSDPKFSHWVVEQDRIVGEAHSVKPADRGMSCAYVRLFRTPETAEHGYIATSRLRAKTNGAHV